MEFPATSGLAGDQVITIRLVGTEEVVHDTEKSFISAKAARMAVKNTAEFWKLSFARICLHRETAPDGDWEEVKDRVQVYAADFVGERDEIRVTEAFFKPGETDPLKKLYSHVYHCYEMPPQDEMQDLSLGDLDFQGLTNRNVVLVQVPVVSGGDAVDESLLRRALQDNEHVREVDGVYNFYMPGPKTRMLAGSKLYIASSVEDE